MSTPSDHASDRPGLRPGGPESLVGVVLSGRYLIEKLIGEGGMGAVYQAEHTHMHKRLAVKVLHPEMSRLPEVVARFEREAMAAAHIEHPNVAAATDFGKLEDGSFFLVLEYVEGQSLREAILAGRLDLGRACHVTRQIASALGRAHALGIVHRDLKPENVMLVVREGDADFVKVLDFGIAKVPIGAFAGESHAPGQPRPVLTQLGMVYGTPEYMAPEQALGQEVDARADLYALGAMLFEMITGTRPYNHDSKVTLLGMHVTAPIPRMSERAPDANVPPDVEAIVTRLLAKEAGARFSDSRELIDALDAAVAELAAAGRIPEPPAPASRLGKRGASDSAIGSALALGPTNLAQPGLLTPGPDSAWGASFRSLKPLASRASAALDDALRSAPPWLTPRRARVAIASVGAAALLAIVLSVGPSPHGSTATGPSAATHVALPPRAADPKVDDLVAAASARIDKSDFAPAIDALLAIEKAGPDRPDVHALLERANTGVHNTHEAMREAGLWLAADPEASADPKLQEDIRNAALFHDGQDDAFALLESKMGARGVDLLFDIAYGASGRQYPQAASRARHSLDIDDVRGRASPALAVLLDFREAKTCEAKRELIDRARAYGDARMASALQPYLATRGCGFFGRADCYPCLHKDTALKEAIGAIGER